MTFTSPGLFNLPCSLSKPVYFLRLWQLHLPNFNGALLEKVDSSTSLFSFNIPSPNLFSLINLLIILPNVTSLARH